MEGIGGEYILLTINGNTDIGDRHMKNSLEGKCISLSDLIKEKYEKLIEPVTAIRGK